MAENDPGPEPSYDPPEPAYDSGAGPTQDFRRRDAGDGSARGSDDRGGARFDGVFDRVPPQDIAAEMATLGGMLMSKEAITDVIEVLHGPEFYKPAHEMIFDAIVEVYNRS